ncbi:hypothetical protein ACJIZ3_015788 [Penstemon smallii]|uniref:VOC domain-containing protein n=1 Tax=Penstemon smallii TaxID=265156 RepID=A0ABD3RNG7_9LAMI
MGKEMIKIDEIQQVLIGRRELPLLSLNHVSFVCKSVQKSVQFYEQVLGFVLIKRPSSFDFEGAWLFNHGIGIHLLEATSEEKVLLVEKKGKIINPKDNHISFQCSDMEVIVKVLEEMKIEYAKAVVKEGGIIVDQLFFHDPDGYMIEICNCHNLPVLPLISSSCPMIINNKSSIMPTPTSTTIINYEKIQCSGEEALMMENFAMDMMNISI